MLSGPVSWLFYMSRTVKLTRPPSCSGRQPTAKWRLSAQNDPLRPGAERTCQLIIRHIEVSQFCQLAELLGQPPCRKSEYQQNTKPLRPGPERTCQLIVRHIEVSQFCQLAELLGQFPCRKSEYQQNTKPLSTGTERSPGFKLTNFPSSLGRPV